MSGDVDYPQGCLPIVNGPSVSQSQQIERLRKLAGCLYDCKPNNDEEVQQPNRFRRLFAHLSDDCFLDNSNSDFRIYLSLCLANILRVFQPEVPTAAALDLKDVYLHLFRTLRGLGEVTTDSPKFKHYFHLVEAIEKILHPLSEMKDFDDKEAHPVFRSLIKEILSVPCGKAWQKNLQRDKKKIRESVEDEETQNGEEEEDEEEEDSIDKIRKVLVTIGVNAITELDYVPNEILDVLFYHIVSPQRTNFVESRLLAQDIIRSCVESGNNNLAQAIENAITSAGKDGKLPEEFELTGSNSRNKYFEVLRCLHHVSYDLVANAIQEMSFWLQSENEAYRREAVQIVGMITSDRNCQFGMDTNDATWAAFLNAAHDVDHSVRLEFVKQSRNVLTSNHSHLRGQIINSLLRLSTDPVDEVRDDVVSAVTEVAKCKLEVISDKMLKTCADRMKDKKPKVRINSIKCLMDLYFHVMTSSPLSYFSKDLNKVADSTSVYTESDKECVRFIPNVVFHLYRLIQKTPAYQDARLTIERYLQLNFIPYKIEVKKRVRLMVDLFRSLDDIGVIMFADVIHRSSQLRRAMIGILSQVGQSANAAKTDYTAQLKERIRRIVQIFPDSTALEKVLMNFVNQMAEDEETFNLVKQLMADNYTSVENQNAAIALKRIMEKKITAKNQVVNFRHFIDRVSPLAFDVPAAKELVHVVSETVTAKFQMKKWADNCIDRDLGLLKIFTENFTHLFTDDQIVEEVRASMLNTEEPRAVEAGLDALSKIFNNSAFRHKVDSEATRREKWYLTMSKDLKDLVVRSDPLYRRSCKLATRLVACLLGKEKSVKFFDEILETLQNRLHLDSEGAANAYQALGEIFRTDVAHFLPQMLDEIESDRIGPSLLSSAEHSENDPVEFNELLHMEKQPWPQLTMTKVYAAKFSTKVITAHSLCPPAEKKRLERASQKFIDVLSEILENKGDLRGRQCELEKARLRAAASSCLLKIAQIAVYRPKFDTTLFKNLSYQITDDAYCVRLHYANHVKKGLGRKLPIEFAACYGLINLGLLEEDGDNKIDGFKAICINQAQQAFSERNEERADLLKLEGPARAMFCSESVIAYAVWLLANYDKLETIEENAQKNDSEDVLEEKVKNVNLLAELQESLWLVIDTLKNARCNMQKVYKVLEKLKTCGDKAKKTDRSLRSADLREQNKKLWAICDLAINMLLYRAKIQNEDQDIKETGYNLQFFYSCEQSNQADPSNVYAPDVLLNDEKHRNGKLPKHGRIFHVSDLTAGFTPPPHNDDSGGSTTLKNTSKRGANTSGTRKRGAKKRKSGGNEESDVEEVVIEEEDEDEVKTKKISPRITRKPRSKREVPDEDVEEILPVSKRRAPPPPQPTPSTSSSTNSSKANGTKNGVSPKKRNSRGRRREIEIEDDEEGNVSLDNLIISPILPETSGRTRRSARTATLTSSTPLVAPKPKQSKRKRQEEEEEEVVIEETEEEEEEAPKAVQVSPKKRSSGGRRRPTPSPTKKKTSSGSPQKKKSAKNEYGLPLDEEEEEEQQKQPTKSATPALRTRTSARLSRK